MHGRSLQPWILEENHLAGHPSGQRRVERGGSMAALLSSKRNAVCGEMRGDYWP